MVFGSSGPLFCFLYYYINSPFLHLSFIISGVSVCSTLATLQNAMHQIKTYRLSLSNHTIYTSPFILIHNCFYFLTYSISDYRCMPYPLYCMAHQQQSADRLTIIKQLTYYDQQQSTINGRLIDCDYWLIDWLTTFSHSMVTC